MTKFHNGTLFASQVVGCQVSVSNWKTYVHLFYRYGRGAMGLRNDFRLTVSTCSVENNSLMNIKIVRGLKTVHVQIK